MTAKATPAPKSVGKSKPKLRTSGKKKQPASSMTSEDISASTAAFLKGGGKIEVIEAGVSGQYNNSKPVAPSASRAAR